MVVYKALYDERGIWINPLSMWENPIEVDGKTVKRFEYVDGSGVSEGGFTVDIAINIVLSVVGLALLIKCADFFVDAAASFARNFKIPATVIGLTIVAFGTSAPELAISFSSHLSGNTDILFGDYIPDGIETPPDNMSGWVMHGEMEICGTNVWFADEATPCIKGDNIRLTATVQSGKDAALIFDALCADGTVTLPPTETYENRHPRSILGSPA